MPKAIFAEMISICLQNFGCSDDLFLSRALFMKLSSSLYSQILNEYDGVYNHKSKYGDYQLSESSVPIYSIL